MKKLKRLANFLFEVGVLQRTPRSGARHLAGWDQSIAEHMFRTTYVGYVLGNLEIEKGRKIDLSKVMQICLFHDFGEARTLDLDYISQKYSVLDELKAVKEAVGKIPFGAKILEIFTEGEERITQEAVIAKDADSVELLCTLKEIIDNGNMLAKDWIPPLLKRLKTDSARELAKAILKSNVNDWWYENKNDTYWITGGKRNNKILNNNKSKK